MKVTWRQGGVEEAAMVDAAKIKETAEGILEGLPAVAQEQVLVQRAATHAAIWIEKLLHSKGRRLNRLKLLELAQRFIHFRACIAEVIDCKETWQEVHGPLTNLIAEVVGNRRDEVQLAEFKEMTEPIMEKYLPRAGTAIVGT